MCLFCNKPATRLCDFPIALVEGGTVKQVGQPAYTVTTMEAMLSGSYTCDAPCCDSHVSQVGHVCGKEPDSIDHCFGHSSENYQPAHSRLLSLEQIAVIRDRQHAVWRRQRVRPVKEDSDA